MGGGGGDRTTEAQAMKRKAMISDIEDEEEDADLAAVIGGSKHRDGSIYRSEVHHLQRLYHLADTRETRLEPMRLSCPADCLPGFTHCKRHLGCAMMQIFYLKLTKLPARAATRGPIELYGFMAVRDLLDPYRNYVFNRTRDNPYIIRDLNVDPFIYLSGPKRGVYMQCLVLIEYDIRMKSGKQEQDDVSLIDGAVTCSELPWIAGPFTDRIKGDYGAEVDISRALLHGAVEATVEVRVIELAKHDGTHAHLDLLISGFLPRIKGEIKLFRGVIREPCELDRFVVATRINSYLFIFFKVLGAAYEVGKFAFRGAAHGNFFDRKELDFATVEVKVTWSTLE